MRNLLSNLLGLGLCFVFATAQAQTVTIENPNGHLPPPQLGISPPQITKSIKLANGKPLNQSVVFYNYNPKPKEISIKLIDVNVDKKQIEPTKATLSPWTLLSPTKFTIPSNGQQTIRLSIRPPVGFPTKKHHAILLIQQYVKDSVTKDEEGVVLNFGSSYALPITINVTNSIEADPARE